MLVAAAAAEGAPAELQRFMSSAEALKKALRRALDGDDDAASELQPQTLLLNV